MEISKSTPYVRYRENISSTLHKGTIHIESEYLDRERKTTIESIEGQTWQNMVNGENKEEDILPRLGMKIEGNEDIFDSKEQHMPIDTIVGDIEPVANEDGTYTYEISTMEGSYAKTLDGENNFSLTSDGLVGDMYIKYNAQGEEVNGNIVMTNGQKEYTIENSNTGEINGAVLSGNTLVNLVTQKSGSFNGTRFLHIPLSRTLNSNTNYFIKFNLRESSLTDGVVCRLRIGTNGNVVGSLESDGIITVTGDGYNYIEFYTKNAVDVTNGLDGIVDDIMIIEYQDDMENWDIPYFEGMQSVKMPVLTTTGKNLFNINIFKNESDELEFPYEKWKMQLKPNTTYIANSSFTRPNNDKTNYDSYGVILNGSEQIEQLYLYHWNLNLSFVNKIFATDDTGVIYLGVYKGDCPYNVWDMVEMQIEEGSTATSYEPYKSNILTVNEDVELRGIGEVQDTLDLMTGEYIQHIGEVIFDGSEDWYNTDKETDNYIMFRSSPFSVELIPPICDRFKTYSTHIPNITETNGELLNLQTDNNCFQFIIKKEKLSSNNAEGFKQWLSQNPTTVQYRLATESIKTVDLTIQDQDDKIIQSLHTHPSTTHINLSSDGLIPSAEMNYTMYGNIGETTGQKITDGTDSKLIEGKIYGDTLLNVLPSPSLKEDDNGNSVSTYLLDMVKPNTSYTTKSSSDCNATIDGTSYPLSANGTFTTPSTITDNLMVLDAPVDDLMFIEGDLTGRELDYFTGLESVDMPVLYTVGKNLFDYKDFKRVIENGSETSLYPINLESNTTYTFSDETGQWNGCRFFLELKDEYNNVVTQIINSNLSNRKSFTFSTNSSKQFYLFMHKNAMGKMDSRSSNFQIEKGSTATSYEPHQSNILTTNEPISLHRIGDVKDELDLVNECVVRKTKCMIFDGSDDENWKLGQSSVNSYGMVHFNYEFIDNNIVGNSIPVLCDKFNYTNGTIHSREKECIGIVSNSIRLVIKADRLSSIDITAFRQWLSKNPITVIYELETPTTESVRIVPQNHRQSTTSLTLQSPLQKAGNVADQLRWNPYKGHYVRYNYIQDGVANSTYIIENLTSLNKRKFVNLYNQRTYIDTDHTVQVISHGLSRYCLAEQGKQYQVRWDWIEQPSADTIKVDLCGNVKEIPSTDNNVIIDVEKFTHQFIQIQGLGLTGKIINLMVIETIDGEIPDVDFFSGIQCVGNTVNIDGNTKVQIDMEQTNGNLIDEEFYVHNNGNSLIFNNSSRLNIKPNKSYTYKIYKNKNDYAYIAYVQFFDKNNNQTRILNCGAVNNEINITELYSNYNETMIRLYTSNIKNDGSIHTHYPFELCYADMAKDGIRPRYYDKESIILPMKLCRVGNIYDNLYYDDLKGYYRIQQSIGHKYFTGETTEVWTMETTNGYRTIKFTCTSANIDQIALGQTICNSFKHLSTINDDMEGFIIYNGNFVLRVDKDRISSANIVTFKEYLASNQIHLFYQLKTPQMINLTEYPKRIELNTYRDEIFTFLKGMNPTKFTLSVPMDKTYRYAIAEEGQGLANRVTVNNETISAENMVAIKEVRGQGIANIIEDVDNVVITPRPNHGAVATSHTLNNTKPATIRIHGFEASGETAVANYNTTDKAYQLKVMSSNGDNSLSDYYVLNVPYKLETYADGTKDMVYYDEAYKQWHFKGSSVKEYTVASDGTLSEVVEVFRGLAPRSGMIAEFKLMFTSGTTNSRMYYSLNGTTYSYTSLKRMTDGNYLYVGIFNTGGTKIDIAYKTDPNKEYTNLSPLSTQIPECFMVNQIQLCTFCEVTLDKQYIYSEINSPIELDTYDGSTKVFMDGNATDTNIIIRNDATTKIVNTYTDTEYTVYWKYVDGLGNLRITLGGTTVEVDGKQEYATIRTQLNAPQELLYVGGYNLSIKDLMVVKGAKIDDLPYFEGSRQVGTLVLDEEGNKSYKITLVQGGSVLEQRDEDTIAFKDDNKHNVVVHKIVGVCPTKVD